MSAKRTGKPNNLSDGMQLLIPVAAYAQRRRALGLPGRSRSSVYQALKTGRIKWAAKGLLDPDECDRLWRENTDPVQGGDRPAGSKKTDAALPPPIEESKRLYEAARARYQQTRALLAEGRVVDADEVRSEAFMCARITRDRLLALPERLAPVLIGVDQVDDIHDILEAEIRSALESLSA